MATTLLAPDAAADADAIEARLREIAIALDTCVHDFHWLVRHDLPHESARVRAHKAALEAERDELHARMQALYRVEA